MQCGRLSTQWEYSNHPCQDCEGFDSRDPRDTASALLGRREDFPRRTNSRRRRQVSPFYSIPSVSALVYFWLLLISFLLRPSLLPLYFDIFWSPVSCYGSPCNRSNSIFLFFFCLSFLVLYCLHYYLAFGSPSVEHFKSRSRNKRAADFPAQKYQLRRPVFSLISYSDPPIYIWAFSFFDIATLLVPPFSYFWRRSFYFLPRFDFHFWYYYFLFLLSVLYFLPLCELFRPHFYYTIPPNIWKTGRNTCARLRLRSFGGRFLLLFYHLALSVLFYLDLYSNYCGHLRRALTFPNLVFLLLSVTLYSASIILVYYLPLSLFYYPVFRITLLVTSHSTFGNPAGPLECLQKWRRHTSGWIAIDVFLKLPSDQHPASRSCHCSFSLSPFCFVFYNFTSIAIL